MGLNPKTDGDKVKALDNSVKNLISFIEKSGEVDFVVLDEVDTDEEDPLNRDTATRNELGAIFSKFALWRRKCRY